METNSPENMMEKNICIFIMLVVGWCRCGCQLKPIKNCRCTERRQAEQMTGDDDGSISREFEELQIRATRNFV